MKFVYSFIVINVHYAMEHLNKKEKRNSFGRTIFYSGFLQKKTSYEFKLIFKKGWKTQNRVLEIYAVIHTYKITMTP